MAGTVPTTRPLTFAHRQAEKLGKGRLGGEVGPGPPAVALGGRLVLLAPLPGWASGVHMFCAETGPSASWLAQGGSRSGHCLVLAPPP